MGSVLFPGKADAILIVDLDAVLPLAVSRQGFQVALPAIRSLRTRQTPAESRRQPGLAAPRSSAYSVFCLPQTTRRDYTLYVKRIVEACLLLTIRLPATLPASPIFRRSPAPTSGRCPGTACPAPAESAPAGSPASAARFARRLLPVRACRPSPGCAGSNTRPPRCSAGPAPPATPGPIPARL